jgi:hypothetical protein
VEPEDRPRRKLTLTSSASQNDWPCALDPPHDGPPPIRRVRGVQDKVLNLRSGAADAGSAEETPDDVRHMMERVLTEDRSDGFYPEEIVSITVNSRRADA